MQADIVIIGAGSAGCAVASRLSEDSRLSVLLLEGGRSDNHPFARIPAASVMAVQNPQFDWCYRTEPDASRGGRVDHWAAGKRLGGGSAINGMMFIRGHRYDYDSWAQAGCDGWDYESVLPYFKRMEANERGPGEFRGADGPLSVSDVRVRHPLIDAWITAATQAGIARCPDLNGSPAEGVDYVQASQRNGWRHSTASAYIRPARRRRNLAVELEAVATRIQVRDGRATAVEFSQGGQSKTVTARRGVVVASGTMASPKLLMLSGIGPAAHLRDVGVEVLIDSPGVGANLQDHVGVHLVCDVSIPTLNSDRGALRGAGHLCNFLFRGRGPLTTPIGHAQAFVKTRDGWPAPNVQIVMAPLAFDLDEKGAIRLCDEPAINQMVAVNRPRSRGTITLRSADPHDKPIIRHQLLGASEDVEQLAEGLAFARRIVGQPAMRQYVVRERRPGSAVQSDEALREFATAYSTCMYHPAGTCRMGSDATSVVDPRLRVRGVQGLWVADASIIPALPAGNINATVVMIGDKAGDLIAAQL